MGRPGTRFRPVFEDLEERRVPAKGPLASWVDQTLDNVSADITSWSLKQGFGDQSATSLFFDHALNGGGKTITIDPYLYPGIYVDLDTNLQLYKSAQEFFDRGRKADVNSFHSKAPDKEIAFKNGDLHYSLNKLEGGVTWSAQKAPDGTWYVMGYFKDLYNFDRIKLFDKPPLSSSIPRATRDLFSRIAKFYGHELEIDGKITPFYVEGTVFYKVLPNTNTLTPFVPPAASQTPTPSPTPNPSPPSNTLVQAYPTVSVGQAFAELAANNPDLPPGGPLTAGSIGYAMNGLVDEGFQPIVIPTASGVVVQFLVPPTQNQTVNMVIQTVNGALLQSVHPTQFQIQAPPGAVDQTVTDWLGNQPTMAGINGALADLTSRGYTGVVIPTVNGVLLQIQKGAEPSPPTPFEAAVAQLLGEWPNGTSIVNTLEYLTQQSSQTTAVATVSGVILNFSNVSGLPQPQPPVTIVQPPQPNPQTTTLEQNLDQLMGNPPTAAGIQAAFDYLSQYQSTGSLPPTNQPAPDAYQLQVQETALFLKQNPRFVQQNPAVAEYYASDPTLAGVLAGIGITETATVGLDVAGTLASVATDTAAYAATAGITAVAGGAEAAFAWLGLIGFGLV